MCAFHLQFISSSVPMRDRIRGRVGAGRGTDEGNGRRWSRPRVISDEGDRGEVTFLRAGDQGQGEPARDNRWGWGQWGEMWVSWQQWCRGCEARGLGFRGQRGDRRSQKGPGVRAWVLSRFGHIWLFVTLWTIAHQAPLSMDFSRHDYWSGLPYPPPGDLQHPGIVPSSLMTPALAGGFFYH